MGYVVVPSGYPYMKLRFSQLVNASALRESQDATQQGKDIGLLTNVTVVGLV